MSFNAIPDKWVLSAVEKDKEYETQEAGKSLHDQWEPSPFTKLAKELYGKDVGCTFFIVGCGPSIEKAKKYLVNLPKSCKIIAVNAAITQIPADYWVFIDLMSYSCYKDCDNAKRAIKLGCDRYWRHFDSDVYVWRRAHTPEDLKEGRIVNWATTLLASMHLAVWFGAVKIVTIGCENRVSDHSDKKEDDFRLGALKVTKEKFLDIQKFTYFRISEALKKFTHLWLPSWCTLLDASDGDLPLPKTYINQEIERADSLWQHYQPSEPISGLNLPTKRLVYVQRPKLIL